MIDKDDDEAIRDMVEARCNRARERANGDGVTRMHFRIDPTNPNTFRRMVKEGRGRGRGADYKPWLTVRDLSSKGESSRLPGWRSGNRLVHLFSKLERNFFYTVEWDPTVVDCREQFPLDLGETVKIAEALGIEHPTSPATGRFWPMTTDFLITKRVDGREVEIARSVKPYVDIETKDSMHPRRVKRNWEKFWIEHEYWKRQGVALAWVTERDFDPVLARNVRQVHGFYHLQSLAPLTPVDVDQLSAEMLPKVGVEPLAQVASGADTKFGLRHGTSLKVALHQIARRNWPVNFKGPLETDKPINVCLS